LSADTVDVSVTAAAAVMASIASALIVLNKLMEAFKIVQDSKAGV
jgi:hypothetical protein